MLLGTVVAVLCVALVVGQGLFPFFQGFHQTPVNQLPPKRRVGRTPNQKLKACCAKVCMHLSDNILKSLTLASSRGHRMQTTFL